MPEREFLFSSVSARSSSGVWQGSMETSVWTETLNLRETGSEV